jgi:hypothetical protein
MTVTGDECKWLLNGALRSVAKIATQASLRSEVSNDIHWCLFARPAPEKPIATIAQDDRAAAE